MPLYLKDIPLPDAQARWRQALQEADRWRRLGEETLRLDLSACGRVLAAPVWAKLSSPHYHASAMDGYAVRAADTEGARLSRPLTLRYGEETEYVDTGDPLPDWADAVIPIELVEMLDAEGSLAAGTRRPAGVRIREAIPPWKNVRALGEDVVATQLLLPAGHVLRPVDLGALAAGGHAEVLVARQPQVAVLPTGSELVPIGQKVRRGQIIEFNSLVLASQVEAWGGRATRFAVIPDTLEAVQEAVWTAAQEHDLILLNAGSSAGSEDYSAPVVEALGELLVHGVAVRPGHPVILGLVEVGDRGKIPIVGVPGYPVSAALTGEIFVEPLLARWQGRQAAEPQTISGTLTRKVTSPAGDDDYLRVAVGQVGERTVVAPLARGAGVITSLVRADGIVVIPRGSQGLAAGDQVDVRLYRQPADLARTLFAIGSHDLTLDLLAQFLAGHNRRLASANVGSLGGLIALRRGEAHLAGCHLLDLETGEYNLSYIRQYLPGVPVRVTRLVGRRQGLLVRGGNPKEIGSLADLSRPEVRFINRQRGAGTRLLLDYHLDQLGIAPEGVQGYNREEFTHLAVAAAVASGRADCGLGIAAAAQALNLDFVDLFEEQYDLVIPVEHAKSSLLAPLYEVLDDPIFTAQVAALPGYDTSQMGILVADIE